MERSTARRQTTDALMVIDMTRGFMPASEGERMTLPGFGELPVSDAERIIPNINRLTLAMGRCAGNVVVAVNDNHPAVTAHFSETPNFVTTWPPHNIQGTPGAELHPNLLIAQRPDLALTFIKGDTPCKTPEDDTSYTAFLAHHPSIGSPLPAYLNERVSGTSYLTGVAIGDGADHPLCVDSSARDFNAANFNIAVVTDAVEAILPENREICFRNMAQAGIRLVTTDQAIAEIMEKQL